MSRGIRGVLEHPRVYQAFQEGFGFFNARVHAMKNLLDIRAGQKIIDIGCGPGFIVKYLPEGVEYHGFDIDERYIDFARTNFGNRGNFYCSYFDESSAREFGEADLAMMNGVLHHLPDEVLLSTVTNIRAALKPGGRLFTVDGCYREGQGRITRYLLDNDRGEYIRTQAGYEALLGKCFERVEMNIAENISRLPYTFVFGLSYRA